MRSVLIFILWATVALVFASGLGDDYKYQWHAGVLTLCMTVLVYFNHKSLEKR